MPFHELQEMARELKIRWPRKIKEKADILDAFEQSGRIEIIAAPAERRDQMVAQETAVRDQDLGEGFTAPAADRVLAVAVLEVPDVGIMIRAERLVLPLRRGLRIDDR